VEEHVSQGRPWLIGAKSCPTKWGRWIAAKPRDGRGRLRSSRMGDESTQTYVQAREATALADDAV
jgi:hypothetical protein